MKSYAQFIELSEAKHKLGMYAMPWAIIRVSEEGDEKELKSHIYPNRLTAESKAKEMTKTAKQGVRYVVKKARPVYKTRIIGNN